MSTQQSGTPVAAMFQGYDTFMSSGMSSAGSGTTTQGSGSEGCNLSVCTTYSQVQTALSISASASATYGPDSVDAKTSFFQSLQITTWTVSVIVYSYTQMEYVGTNLNLNTGVSTSDLNQFCATYGDSYVSTLYQGGEYMAAYVFYAQSEEEQTSVVSSLGASGISDGMALSASTQDSLTEATTNITTSQYFNQQLDGFTGQTLLGRLSGKVRFSIAASVKPRPDYLMRCPFSLRLMTQHGALASLRGRR